MRFWGVLAAAVLAVADQAKAAEDDTWRSELQLEAPLTAAYQSPIVLTPELTGRWYFQALVDDGRAPLGLLPFLQHLDTVTLSVGTSGNLHGSLAGTLYFWRDTGVTASLTGGITPATATVSTTYAVGLLQYFSRSFRTELHYLGTRTSSGLVNAVGNLAVDDSASDKGRVTASLLFGERALLTISGELGVLQGLRASVEATGPGTTVEQSSYQGTQWTANATFTGYVSRNLSATLGIGARWTLFPEVTGSFSRSRSFALLGSPGVEVFLTDAAYLRAAYALDYNRVLTLDRNEVTVAPTHRLTLTFGGRF